MVRADSEQPRQAREKEGGIEGGELKRGEIVRELSPRWRSRIFYCLLPGQTMSFLPMDRLSGIGPAG